MTETTAAFRAEAEAMDDALPKATGADAEGMDRFRSRVAAARPGRKSRRPRRHQPRRRSIFTKLNIPILAVNGSFDNPYRKTHRLWREAQTFQNVILPGKTHLTAIAAGAPPDAQYVQVIAAFIEMYDVKLKRRSWKLKLAGWQLSCHFPISFPVPTETGKWPLDW